MTIRCCCSCSKQSTLLSSFNTLNKKVEEARIRRKKKKRFFFLKPNVVVVVFYVYLFQVVFQAKAIYICTSWAKKMVRYSITPVSYLRRCDRHMNVLLGMHLIIVDDVYLPRNHHLFLPPQQNNNRHRQSSSEVEDCSANDLCVATA